VKDTKVCVAICNYNHSKYLRESLCSVVKQDYSNIDIAVIDDGSTDQDKVKEIVESFDDKRIRLVCLKENLGKWNALNIAFGTTDATLCTSHDADDVSLPWRISSQVEAITKTNTLHNLCGFLSCWSDDDMSKNLGLKRPDQLKIATGEDVANAVIYGFKTPGINHYFTGNFETAGVSAMFHKLIWDMGLRFNPPKSGLRVLLSEDSDFNCRATLLLRSTSVLLETPYLYRRNTSTNKEEK
jgi:glycosyltransferase involved in cell wall biosynthesis